MALRSLVVMLKALPRRMPGSGAFAPKGDPWSKSSTRLTDPPGYEAWAKKYPLLHQSIMRCQEENRKTIKVVNRNAVLLGIVSFGFMGHIASEYDFLA